MEKERRLNDKRLALKKAGFFSVRQVCVENWTHRAGMQRKGNKNKRDGSRCASKNKFISLFLDFFHKKGLTIKGLYVIIKLILNLDKGG